MGLGSEWGRVEQERRQFVEVAKERITEFIGNHAAKLTRRNQGRKDRVEVEVAHTFVILVLHELHASHPGACEEMYISIEEDDPIRFPVKRFLQYVLGPAIVAFAYAEEGEEKDSAEGMFILIAILEEVLLPLVTQRFGMEYYKSERVTPEVYLKPREVTAEGAFRRLRLLRSKLKGRKWPFKIRS